MARTQLFVVTTDPRLPTQDLSPSRGSALRRAATVSPTLSFSPLPLPLSLPLSLSLSPSFSPSLPLHLSLSLPLSLSLFLSLRRAATVLYIPLQGEEEHPLIRTQSSVLNSEVSSFWVLLSRQMWHLIMEASHCIIIIMTDHLKFVSHSSTRP